MAAVVNLSVLAEQEACPPDGSDPGHFPLQAQAIQVCAPGRRWVAVPFFWASEGHDDAAVSQPAAQAAVCFDLGDPGGDPVQAGLAQLQEGACESLRMGGEHAGGHKAGRFAAAPAEQHHGQSAACQLVGNG